MGRASSVQGGRREGTGCSPQFLSSRPLGQSLIPSHAGTHSPFTEQRNSPGQAGHPQEAMETEEWKQKSTLRIHGMKYVHLYPYMNMISAHTPAPVPAWCLWSLQSCIQTTHTKGYM